MINFERSRGYEHRWMRRYNKNSDFNGVMRDFIQNGQGKTLQQAIDRWHQHQIEPRAEKNIEPQFEYNQHIRQFFAAYIGKTLHDAIAAWQEKKARRKTATL